MLFFACTDVNLGVPVACDLNANVSGSAESVNSQCASSANAGGSQAAKADDARAQQRRGLQIGKVVGKRIDKIFVPDGVFRISSGNGVAGKFRMVAQVLTSAAAVRTGAVSLVQPGNSYAR